MNTRPANPDDLLVRPTPAQTAVKMLELGYSRDYVTLWLWHATRAEADLWEQVDPAPGEETPPWAFPGVLK